MLVSVFKEAKNNGCRKCYFGNAQVSRIDDCEGGSCYIAHKPIDLKKKIYWMIIALQCKYAGFCSTTT